jgi:hypothetical protein
MPSLPPLRARLAEAVAASKAAEAPPGAFTAWSSAPQIFFWTTGRRTGLSRQKEWAPFAAWGSTLYLVDDSHGTADWVRNALRWGIAEVALTTSAPRLPVRVRTVDDAEEARRAREALHRRFSYGNLRQAFIDDSPIVAFDA